MSTNILKQNKHGPFARLISASLISLIATTSLASQTQDLLIDKLRFIYRDLEESHSTKPGIALRLADLLADRSRLVYQEQIKNNCNDCHKDQADRLEALGLYQWAEPRIPEAARARVILQQGHLQELEGNEVLAIASYQRILQQLPTGNSIRGEAAFSLAELHFRSRRYPEAFQFYEVSLGEPEVAKGLVSYRQAWCHFYLGKVNLAAELLQKQLSDPRLLLRTVEKEKEIDVQFHEEVSRDFATMIAGGAFSEDKIERLMSLSPAQIQIANVIFLGRELERVGKKVEALHVWDFLIRKNLNPNLTTQALAHRASLQTDLMGVAIADYQLAHKSIRARGECIDDGCLETNLVLNQLIRDFQVRQKAKPTAEYRIYLSEHLQSFPLDREIRFILANYLSEQRDFAEAFSHLSILVNDDSQKAQIESPEIRESLLLKRIEIAEQSKNSDWLMQAQNVF